MANGKSYFSLLFFVIFLVNTSLELHASIDKKVMHKRYASECPPGQFCPSGKRRAPEISAEDLFLRYLMRKELKRLGIATINSRQKALMEAKRVNQTKIGYGRLYPTEKKEFLDDIEKNPTEYDERYWGSRRSRISRRFRTSSTNVNVRLNSGGHRDRDRPRFVNGYQGGNRGYGADDRLYDQWAIRK